MSSRPQPDEYAGFFARYVDRVPDGDIVAILESQGNATQTLLASIGEEKGGYRYGPDKWSIKQVVGHMADAERVFAYRLLAIARGEKQSLPGFEENDYVDAANFDARSLAELAEGFAATRRATLALARSLDEEAWNRRGLANNNAISARAIAWVTAGHERHHLNILQERYGIAT
ncbi:MAG TPA: DinB family protein [Thermoanaerobaculia bacterium]|jgi:uncharacterized damage-inducible protein DinB|nr:DinB family protein [Thermoanaerobaculia bacterium]